MNSTHHIPLGPFWVKIFLFALVAIVVLFLWVGEMFDWMQLFEDVFTNKTKKH